ncbi:MAG: ATP-binding protein, partial [Selenomonadaceae bacterium]|nr:ATP-binding protein [Selenomonadaceae bacterium]
EVLLTPERRQVVLKSLHEPTPPKPKENYSTRFRRAWEAGAPAREVRFRQEAMPYCRRYGLDAARDRLQIDALIKAGQRLADCAGCNGIDCRHDVNPIETVSISDTGQISWVPCRVEAMRRIAKILPKKFAAKTFDDYEITADNSRAVGMAHWFIDRGDGHSLYLHGGFGAGKTFLATLIAKEFISRGKYVVFGSVPKLMNEIQQTFKDPSVTSQSVLRRFINCDLLILDDIGANASKWTVQILCQIIDGRTNDERPMLLTANYTLKGLHELFAHEDAYNAGRINSRLQGCCYVAYLGARDRRCS